MTSEGFDATQFDESPTNGYPCRICGALVARLSYTRELHLDWHRGHGDYKPQLSPEAEAEIHAKLSSPPRAHD